MPAYVQFAIAVGFGGFFGALARYGVSQALNPEPGHFPWGTLFANLLGCLLIGVAHGYFARRGDAVSAWVPLALVTGFMGSFTTFSTFSLETVLMWRAGNLRGAIAYVVTSMVCGVGLAVLGTRFFASGPVS